MERDRYKILYSSGTTYELPIFLESSVDEMGVMVGFDGDICEINELTKFIEGDHMDFLTSSGGTANIDEPTENTTFKHISIGSSKIGQLKKYGSETYDGVTFGTDEIGVFSGYTIDDFDYKDYEDNYTIITGNTEAYTKEEVINNVITRNEHFIGFVDEPTIYSDIFIERGRLGVMEHNFRLTEADNIGELVAYGNGFFNIKKQ